jgi:hypothetical protein
MRIGNVSMTAMAAYLAQNLLRSNPYPTIIFIGVV